MSPFVGEHSLDTVRVMSQAYSPLRATAGTLVQVLVSWSVPGPHAFARWHAMIWFMLVETCICRDAERRQSFTRSLKPDPWSLAAPLPIVLRDL